MCFVLYNLICPIQHWERVLCDAVAQSLILASRDIETRYEIYFVEIGK